MQIFDNTKNFFRYIILLCLLISLSSNCNLMQWSVFRFNSCVESPFENSMIQGGGGRFKKKEAFLKLCNHFMPSDENSDSQWPFDNNFFDSIPYDMYNYVFS